MMAGACSTGGSSSANVDAGADGGTASNSGTPYADAAAPDSLSESTTSDSFGDSTMQGDSSGDATMAGDSAGDATSGIDASAPTDAASDGSESPSSDSGNDGPVVDAPADSNGSADGGVAVRGCLMLTPTCGTTSPCTDLPANPVIDVNTPANAPQYFTGADSPDAGPCIVEPPDGAIVPQNWIRPRFRVIPVGGQDLFEMRVHIDTQANDLVVYTANQSWTLPQDIWDNIRVSSVDRDITVTVRGVDATATVPTTSSSTAVFRIAPATVSGSIVYFAATNSGVTVQSWLEGFHAGDETIRTVLTTPQVAWTTPLSPYGTPIPGDAGAPTCVGCHSLVPDGDAGSAQDIAFIGSSDYLSYLDMPGAMASIDPTTVGTIPPYVTPGGEQAFNQPKLGLSTFSANDWSTEHVAITSYGQVLDMSQCDAGAAQFAGCPYCGYYEPFGNESASLAWFDLASPAPYIDAGSFSGGYLGNYLLGSQLGSDVNVSFGILQRQGDSQGAELPNWSHNGATITYVSTDAGVYGHLGTGSADLYSIPYNGRKGGVATPVPGASDPTVGEYYPFYSPDDRYLAFTRAPAGTNMYFNADGEVYVVPAPSGKPAFSKRLAANDPPACSSVVSPGVTNSWLRWSPDVTTCANGQTYYWLVFSSTRDGVTWGASTLGGISKERSSQLYLTAISVDETTGLITTYPAVYIWNQPSVAVAPSDAGTLPQTNLTPSWENVVFP
jgi:hypothetical protein